MSRLLLIGSDLG